MDTNVIEQGFQRVWQMFQETDKEIKEIWQQIRESQEKPTRQIEKTDEKFDKYFGKLQEYERNWGKLVELLVKPSVATQFQKRGIPVMHTFQRVEGTRNGDNKVFE